MIFFLLAGLPCVNAAEPMIEQTAISEPSVGIKKYADDCYFVFAPVNDQNRQFWITYAKASMEHVKALLLKIPHSGAELTKEQEILVGYMGAMEVFEHNISHLSKNCEMYVCYATNSEKVIDFTKAEESFKDVVMSFSVLTSQDAPFVVHMGIARGVFSQNGLKGIAVALHSFAARQMLAIHPEKIYMVTNPLGHMRNIFIEAFSHLDQFYLGDKNSIAVNEKGLSELGSQMPEQVSIKFRELLDLCKQKVNPFQFQSVGTEKSVELSDPDTGKVLWKSPEDPQYWLKEEHNGMWTPYGLLMTVPLSELAAAVHPISK